MMRKWRKMLIPLWVAAGCYETGTAFAQEPEGPPVPAVRLELPEPSQGQFVAVGVHGVGSMAFETLGQDREPSFGQGVSIRFGQSVTEWLDLSLQFALASTGGQAEDDLTFGRFSVHSQWYLTQKWFVQAAIGAGSVSGNDPRDTQFQRGGYGAAYALGVGRNFFLSQPDSSGGWVVAPVATLDFYPNGDYTATGLWFGLEVSWWSGLSKDKLELPLERAYE